MSKHQIKRIIQIWDTQFEDHIEIGPDQFNRGFMEIRKFNDRNVMIEKMLFTRDQMRSLVQAATELLSDE
jgi:hypothetical protein